MHRTIHHKTWIWRTHGAHGFCYFKTCGFTDMLLKANYFWNSEKGEGQETRVHFHNHHPSKLYGYRFPRFHLFSNFKIDSLRELGEPKESASLLFKSCCQRSLDSGLEWFWTLPKRNLNSAIILVASPPAVIYLRCLQL